MGVPSPNGSELSPPLPHESGLDEHGLAANGNGAATIDSPTRQTENLFAEHSGRIYRFCVRRLGSPQEAEDALQATYLNAWRSLKGGTRPHDAVPWLFQIAANVCATVLRNRSRGGTVELLPPADLEQVAGMEADSDDLLGLTEALEALPERQRQALLLRDWRGFSYEEIAGALDASHPAVETLLFRARRAVAASLTKPVSRARRIPVRSALSALLPWPSAFSSAKAALTGGAGATKVAIAVGVGATAPILAFGLVEGALEKRDPPPLARAATPAVQPDAWLPSTTIGGEPATAEATRSRPAAASSPAKQPRRPVRSGSVQDGTRGAESTIGALSATATGSGTDAASEAGDSATHGQVPTEPDPPDPVPAEPAPSEAPPSENPGEAEASAKVAVCHATESKKNPSVTVYVASAATDGHLAHGDQLGPCPS